MPMDDMDSGQQVKEGMMSAAVSFLRYFLLKIVSADYFYELCPGVHRNKPSFFSVFYALSKRFFYSILCREYSDKSCG
ncbi:hypothetical protein ACCW85_23735 [Raoultella planticola]|uniref:hypothetical protein n=1 Tax=Raoultella planticola TaxID=575 RepID=UPI003EDA9F47